VRGVITPVFPFQTDPPVSIWQTRCSGCGPLATMEGEDAYETAVKKFKADAAAVEAAWAAQRDDNATKAAACPSIIQGTSYREMGWRSRSIWVETECPRCELPGSGDNTHV
jgi:hypothetical protein